MTCPVCGGQIAAGTTRCAQCGSRIDLADSQAGVAYASSPTSEAREEVPTNPMDAFERVISKYADFDGRATRSEYWWFTLANVIVSIGLAIIGARVHLPWMYLLYSVGVMIPTLALSVRRLHDTGRTGWWLLIALLPIIGAIVLFIYAVQDSQRGRNTYGPNPKGE